MNKQYRLISREEPIKHGDQWSETGTLWEVISPLAMSINPIGLTLNNLSAEIGSSLLIKMMRREIAPLVGGWQYLGGVNSTQKVTEVLAAKSEDGIGIMARWMLKPDQTWSVEVWHMEMESEGIDADDGDSVPPTPPVFNPANK